MRGEEKHDVGPVLGRELRERSLDVLRDRLRHAGKREDHAVSAARRMFYAA